VASAVGRVPTAGATALLLATRPLAALRLSTLLLAALLLAPG
jgi:hypothetical protein